MFEFITISNGVAVVQHAPTGHVYRFRPVRSGLWNRLTLDKVDAAPPPASCPDDHADAALRFAEDVAAALRQAAPNTAEPAQRRQAGTRRALSLTSWVGLR